MLYYLYVLLLALVNAQYLIAAEVKVCDDEIEFPPFTYFQRSPDHALDTNQTQRIGITQEVLSKIFSNIDLTYKIDHIPWKRCIFEVEKFETRKAYEMFATGSFFTKRASKYYTTSAYGVVNQGIFYSTNKYPDGINIQSIEDLQQFDVICGVLGYSYRAYRLTDESKFTRSPTIIAGLKMLESDRCQVMPLGIEVAHGLQLLDQYRIPKTVKAVKISAIKPTTFHLFISKSSPRAFEIYTKVNHELIRLIHTGELEKIHKKYRHISGL
ncbi:substrate-binding periplasmic protein [Zooshikella harenae]|uniref:Transporter substrate-binding domain-containing protein n=1 Tax=Zooshikella harenae TaxID=2827238 RepID=A0ABS5ZH85_9GAMM|nr:transporter substrate-binding domain-containing protein [Zooshikella harenae]MBU2713421.1 transporter substrate-binding domain-containing protein [Zooshikella harenae]